MSANRSSLSASAKAYVSAVSATSASLVVVQDEDTSDLVNFRLSGPHSLPQKTGRDAPSNIFAFCGHQGWLTDSERTVGLGEQWSKKSAAGGFGNLGFKAGAGPPERTYQEWVCTLKYLDMKDANYDLCEVAQNPTTDQEIRQAKCTAVAAQKHDMIVQWMNDYKIESVKPYEKLLDLIGDFCQNPESSKLKDQMTKSDYVQPSVGLFYLGRFQTLKELIKEELDQAAGNHLKSLTKAREAIQQAKLLQQYRHGANLFPPDDVVMDKGAKKQLKARQAWYKAVTEAWVGRAIRFMPLHSGGVPPNKTSDSVLRQHQVVEKQIRILQTQLRNENENQELPQLETDRDEIFGPFFEKKVHTRMVEQLEEVCGKPHTDVPYVKAQLKYVQDNIELLEKLVDSGKQNLTQAIKWIASDPRISMEVYYDQWEQNMGHHYKTCARWMDLLFFSCLMSGGAHYKQLDADYGRWKNAIKWEPLNRECEINDKIRDIKKKMDDVYVKNDTYRPVFFGPSSAGAERPRSPSPVAATGPPTHDGPFKNVKLVDLKLRARVGFQPEELIFSEQMLAFHWYSSQGLFCSTCHKVTASRMQFEPCDGCNRDVFCSLPCKKLAKSHQNCDKKGAVNGALACLTRNSNLVYQILRWFGLKNLKDLKEMKFTPISDFMNLHDWKNAAISILFGSTPQPDLQKPLDYLLLLDAFQLYEFFARNHPESCLSQAEMITLLYRMLYSLQCNPMASSPLVKAKSASKKKKKSKKRGPAKGNVNSEKRITYGHGVSPLAALMEHSCKPNVVRQYNPVTGRVEYLAGTNIQPNDQLFLPWGVSVRQYPLGEPSRVEQISGRFKRDCACEYCVYARANQPKNEVFVPQLLTEALDRPDASGTPPSSARPDSFTTPTQPKGRRFA